MSYLLDTCFLSEMFKPQPDAGVVDWVNAVDEERLFVSVLSLGEIQKGIAKLENGRRRRKIQTWLDQDLRNRFHDRILPLDLECALGWVEIRGASEKNGRPAPVIDSLLAATAQAHNLVLVTRYENDFQGYPIGVLNPWNGS